MGIDLHLPSPCVRPISRRDAEVERDFISTHRPTSLIKRLTTVEEVANLGTYLASEQASATIGAAVRVVKECCVRLFDIACLSQA